MKKYTAFICINNTNWNISKYFFFFVFEEEWLCPASSKVEIMQSLQSLGKLSRYVKALGGISMIF